MALTIGADDVTLDLGGHSLQSRRGVGLRVDGHDGVTVENGTIESPTTAVSVTEASDLTIAGVAIVSVGNTEDNFFGRMGLLLDRVEHSRVTTTSITGYRALVMHNSSYNHIDHVTSSGDVDNSVQLSLAGSDHNTLTDNFFTGAGGDNALIVDSHFNTLQRNNLIGSNGGSLGVVSSNHTTLRANLVGSEVGGIDLLYAQDTLITGNHGSVGPDRSIRVNASVRTTVSGNDVGPIEVHGSANTVVRDNLVSPLFYGSDGLTVDVDSSGTQLLKNRVSGFAGDGIIVDSRTTILRANTANRNGQLGINATAGVIDGGGNKASGNADARQCVNVLCA